MTFSYLGRTIKVYKQVDTQIETCNFGTDHRVYIYEVKRIKVYAVSTELVRFLNYTSDGYGEVLYAKDAQRRVYRKEPHWDGPRATLWVREDNKTFDQYPTKIAPGRDLTGRLLSL